MVQVVETPAILEDWNGVIRGLDGANGWIRWIRGGRIVLFSRECARYM